MGLARFAGKSPFAGLGRAKPASAESDDEDKEKKNKKSESEQDDEDKEKKNKKSDAEDGDGEDREKKNKKSDAEDGDDEDEEKKEKKSESEDDDEDKDKKKGKGKKSESDDEGDDDPEARVRASERARIKAIAESEAGRANPDAAYELAVNTDMSASNAIALLRSIGPAAAVKSGGLQDRMSREPRHEVGSDVSSPAANDPKGLAGRIIAAHRKANGEAA